MSHLSESPGSISRWDAPRREVHVMVSAAGTITAAAGACWPGLDPARLPGHHVTALARPDEAATVTALLGTDGVARTRLPTPDDRWVSWTAQPVTDGTVLHGVDVTAVVALERDADRAWTALRELVHAVSHDVRAPVRLMAAFAERLVRRYGEGLDGRAAQYVEQISDGAERANAMLDGLLSYSRALHHDPAPEAVALRPAVEEAVARTATLGVAVDHVLEVDPDHVVVVDPDVLRLVLHAVLDNAVRHRGDLATPGLVTVTAGVEDGTAVVVVHDDGPGIPASERDAVFAPFHRLAPHAPGAGTGTGLTVARAAAEAVGGSLTLDARTQDEDGEHGTTVTLRLPPPVEEVTA